MPLEKPPRTKGKEEGVRARRLLHMLWGAVVLYYIFPPLVFDFPTAVFLMIFLVLCPLEVEYMRLRHGLLFFGMRSYERGRVASYLWFIMGAMALILLVPQQIAVPCILATAVVDPAISATRHWRRRYTLTLTTALAAGMFLAFGYSPVMALLAAGLAIVSESVDLRLRLSLRPNLMYSRSRRRISRLNSFFDAMTRFDDDFTMQVIPAVVLVLVYINAPWLFPQPMLQPVVPVEEWTRIVNSYLGI